LVFYAAGQLAAAPAVLVSSATSFGSFAQTDGAAYFIVAVPDATNPQTQLDYLYKVTSSGAAALVYTAVGGLGGSLPVVDSSNLYFTDTVAGIITTIFELPLQSDTVQPLYVTDPVTLIGSTGSVLVFGHISTIGAPIATIPVNVASKTESMLVSSAGNYLTTAFLDSSNTYLFANYLTTGAGPVPGTSATAVTTGMQLQASASSMFVQSGDATLLLSGVASTLNLGGGTIYNYDAMTASQTPLTLPGGSAYTLPQGYDASFRALSSAGTGALNLQSPYGSGPAIGAVYDTSTNTIVPLSPANTNVSVW
jgi:hypothetical protein